MRYRSPARWLAPLAILGSVAAIMLVISSAENGKSTGTQASDAGITSSTNTGSSTTGTTTTPASTSGRRFYVVKDGDVLSGIADKTGVPLTVIEQLNPTVDAQSLHAGQRIKLRP
jgi:LysM repeat protein